MDSFPLGLAPRPAPDLLPGSVERFGLLAPSELPEELSGLDPELPTRIRRATPKRRLEFWAGRRCAQICLETLGFPDHRLAIQDDRSPLWPEGVFGSITHTRGLVWAAVTKDPRILGLGIDSEPLVRARTLPALRSHAAREEELGDLSKSGLSEPEALTVLFSAKESLYKCLYPTVRRFFGFQDARLSWEGPGWFRWELTVDLHPTLPRGSQGRGRFEIHEGLISTAIVWMPNP